ncbi:MAG: hypothetical protein KatS3mg084_0256 [Candidatus Dojkabacteria bacterium]|jgi:DNA-binding YbaB/EbfC family protein|nr:MAG: hypothetical protein KatS3mg084_0256 [Candidatus Dojkabacteria bacterium]
MINPIKAGQNLWNLKKQADNLQKKMREVLVSGESKKGLVKVTINGLKEVVDIRIDDVLIGDKAELVKHIKEAFNNAGKEFDKQAYKFVDKDQTLGMLQDLLK